jgi:hypothetical protein
MSLSVLRWARVRPHAGMSDGVATTGYGHGVQPWPWQAAFTQPWVLGTLPSSSMSAGGSVLFSPVFIFVVKLGSPVVVLICHPEYAQHSVVARCLF